MLWKPHLPLLASACIAATLLPAGPPPETKGMPYELAFRRKTFQVQANPVVSPDGTLVAYVVRTPPERSPGHNLPVEPRFLPNGTPAGAVGSRLLVTEVATGKTQTVCPETGNCWRPSWSPDGKLLVFFSDAGGPPQLWAFHQDRRQPRRISSVAVKAKHWMGDEAQWSPDGKEVYVPLNLTPAAPKPASEPASPDGAAPPPRVYRHGREIENQPEAKKPDPMDFSATLAAIDVASGKIRILAPAETDPQPSCLRLSPGGKWVSYLSVQRLKNPRDFEPHYDLAVMPAAGGAVRVLARDLELPFNADNYFTDTYRWRPAGDQLVYMKGRRLWRIQAAGAGQPIPLGAELGDLTESPLRFTSDGNWILVGKAAAGPQGYYLSAPVELALAPFDGGPPRTVPIGNKWRYRGVAALGKSNLLTLVLEERASAETALVQLDLDSGAERVLWKGAFRFNAMDAEADRDSRLGILESFDAPPDIYGFPSDFSTKRRVSHIEPRLDEFAPGRVETFETLVPQFDGKLIPVKAAVLLPPGARRGDRLPAVVTMYGGSRGSPSRDVFGGGVPASVPAPLLTSRGFAVLLADVPLSPHGKPGNPVRDLADALLPQIHRAAELGYLDLDRVAVMGHSNGAYEAAAVTTVSNLFKAAVAISGMYDLPGNYSRMDRSGTNFKANWLETGGGRMGTHPWADLKRYVDNSPYYQADKIHTPLLLLHGENDSACPVDEAEKFYYALKRLDKTVHLAVYPGEGHVPTEWSLNSAVDGARRIVEFLEKYLKPRASNQ